MARAYVASSWPQTTISMHPILTIKNASKRFIMPEGGEIRALDDVSLSVAPNEFLTLLGPSGCGKTTLLRVISGFEDLDAGEVAIEGQSMTHEPAYRRPVNTVFQKYALFPHLSVARNVAYSLEIKKVPKPEVRKRVSEMLELVGLAGQENRKINQLSGGQQQRVALARSLIARPKILLLDEPLSALDKNLRHRMQQELKNLQDELGISFVFVTHDQEEALVMSDRIAVLRGGKVQQLDAPQTLYNRPANEFVARFIGESNIFSGIVRDCSDDGMTILLEDGSIMNVVSAGFRQGDKVKVLIRPENIVLTDQAIASGYRVSATVTEQYFVGSDFRLVVAAEGLPSLKVTLRQTGSCRAHDLIPGARIELELPRESLHVIPAA